ncbi:MAG: hypothetical protein ABL986_00340 [Vicinamibacterales bacterium]
MPTMLLADLISQNRTELLDRWAEKTRRAGALTAVRPDAGIPVFVDQLVDVLRHGSASASDMSASAAEHGRDLFAEAFTVDQLVHDYGGVCQAITDLAVDTGVAIRADEFRTLNQCLDDAIADAVSEYTARQQAINDYDDVHFRNLVYMAVASLEAIRQGDCGVAGATGDVLQRSLSALSDLARNQSSEGHREHVRPRLRLRLQPSTPSRFQEFKRSKNENAGTERQ